MSRTKTLALAVLALAMFAGGCKKKPPPPPPPPAPPPVEVRLQVTSLSPSTIAPKTPTPAKVYGSAFESGATVTFTGPMELRGQEVSVDSGNTMSVTIPGLVEGTYDVKVENPDGTSSVLRSGLTVKSLEIACRNVTVNFDFDQAGLRNDAKSTLDGNMSCFQSLTGQIAIEGHADERGTVDYNLALGQRRADTVKRYLVNSGVATGRISTTTYGEERPVDRGHTEVAWARNRRAEIIATE
ncbi:MAG: OmpA family protein [Myxococcota bacterium]